MMGHSSHECELRGIGLLFYPNQHQTGLFQSPLKPNAQGCHTHSPNPL